MFANTWSLQFKKRLSSLTFLIFFFHSYHQQSYTTQPCGEGRDRRDNIVFGNEGLSLSSGSPALWLWGHGQATYLSKSHLWNQGNHIWFRCYCVVFLWILKNKICFWIFGKMSVHFIMFIIKIKGIQMYIHVHIYSQTLC